MVLLSDHDWYSACCDSMSTDVDSMTLVVREATAADRDAVLGACSEGVYNGTTSMALSHHVHTTYIEPFVTSH